MEEINKVSRSSQRKIKPADRTGCFLQIPVRGRRALCRTKFGYAVVAYPGVAKPDEFFPEGLLDAMIDNDFEFAANNRAAILKEWQSRYDGKSDPK